jgi:glycosyltransferase involved in cell wall biosynthesis
LAERLAFCFDHPELVSEMGYKARKIAETTYSPEMHLKRLENLFAELVGKS